VLAVLCDNVADGTEIEAVEQPFKVAFVDQETGELLDRDLVGKIDVLERDPERRLVVVDLKTAARKYTDLQVEMSLQLSIYSYAASMNGLADQDDVRLRFDVLTQTRVPELHRYWTTRDLAANVRLLRLAAEVCCERSNSPQLARPAVWNRRPSTMTHRVVDHLATKACEA
jgi:hypothetical protein